MLIVTGKLTKLPNTIQIKIYNNNTKAGNITALQDLGGANTDMRIVILGCIWNGGLVEVRAVGFGWNNCIYYDNSLYNHMHIQIGLIN